MTRRNLRPALGVLLLLGAGAFSPICAGLRDNNLIEFSRGSYANMRIATMLWPPELKNYQDGKVIHYEGGEDRKYYVSQLDPQQLESLKKRLAGESYFWKSRSIQMDGDDINVHGGVSYIRYLDGDNEIILVTDVKPSGGPWVRLINDLWEYVPEDHEHLFYPNSIGVQTWTNDIADYLDEIPPAWPFGQQIQLNSKLKIISNREIIRYLFDRLKGVFSFYVWSFKQDEKIYSFSLVNVPGWFQPDYTNKALTKVWKNGVRTIEYGVRTRPPI